MISSRFFIFFLIAWIWAAATSFALEEAAITGSAENTGDLPPSPASVSVSAGSLDLESAIRTALSKNPGLEAAAARVREAKERIDQARSAYFPRLDAAGSVYRTDFSDTDHESQLLMARIISPQAQIEDPQDGYTIGLSLSYTLFDGFERRYRLLSARHGREASAAALEDARRLIISAVAAAFLGAQLSLENISIAKADEVFNGRLLEDAQIRHRVGTGTLSEVLNFQVRMNQAVTQRIEQENGYEVALFGLAALMGLSDARLPEDMKPANLDALRQGDLEQPRTDALIQQALDTRPDLLRLRYSLKQAEDGIQMARAGYYPSVSLSGVYTGERTDDPRFSGEDFGNRIELGLSYNLFAGGLTRASVREAEQRRVGIMKDIENLSLLVTSEIRAAASSVLTAQVQVRLQEENTRLVTRTRDLVEKEYRAGQGSLVRLNEAQRDLTSAQGKLALAKVALRQAWVELETRSGPAPGRYAP